MAKHQSINQSIKTVVCEQPNFRKENTIVQLCHLKKAQFGGHFREEMDDYVKYSTRSKRIWLFKGHLQEPSTVNLDENQTKQGFNW